jgi:hypothetical protein
MTRHLSKCFFLPEISANRATCSWLGLARARLSEAGATHRSRKDCSHHCGVRQGEEGCLAQRDIIPHRAKSIVWDEWLVNGFVATRYAPPSGPTASPQTDGEITPAGAGIASKFPVINMLFRRSSKEIKSFFPIVRSARPSKTDWRFIPIGFPSGLNTCSCACSWAAR